MKKHINRVSFDNIEKKMLEDEPVGVHGVIPGKIFNGEMRGNKGEFYLKCHNCGLVLDSQSYKKIRKFQKKTKKRILTEEELIQAVAKND